MADELARLQLPLESMDEGERALMEQLFTDALRRLSFGGQPDSIDAVLAAQVAQEFYLLVRDGFSALDEYNAAVEKGTAVEKEHARFRAIDARYRRRNLAFQMLREALQLSKDMKLRNAGLPSNVVPYPGRQASGG